MVWCMDMLLRVSSVGIIKKLLLIFINFVIMFIIIVVGMSFVRDILLLVVMFMGLSIKWLVSNIMMVNNISCVRLLKYWESCVFR